MLFIIYNLYSSIDSRFIYLFMTKNKCCSFFSILYLTIICITFFVLVIQD